MKRGADVALQVAVDDDRCAVIDVVQRHAADAAVEREQSARGDVDRGRVQCRERRPGTDAGVTVSRRIVETLSWPPAAVIFNCDVAAGSADRHRGDRAARPLTVGQRERAAAGPHQFHAHLRAVGVDERDGVAAGEREDVVAAQQLAPFQRLESEGGRRTD